MDKEYLGKISPKKNFSIREIFDCAMEKVSVEEKKLIEFIYEALYKKHNIDNTTKIIINNSIVYKEGIKYKIYKIRDKNCYEVETEGDLPNLSFEKCERKAFYIGDYFDISQLENGAKS